MKHIPFAFILLLCSISTNLSFAQSDNQKLASAKAAEAVRLMDDGEISKSLILLKEAQKLDPNEIDYPYETAYAHYLNKDYKSAIKVLNKLTKHPNVNQLVYQLLGNSYSMNNQREKAIQTYEKGIELFPNSGRLFLERGNMELFVKDYSKALSFYERGILAEPKFPSNYFWASKIYCNSSEEVWGMIYGEIFMNLERGSKRTVEISRLLFDTYKSEIKFTNDTSLQVSFSKSAVIQISDITNIEDIKLPFGIGVYELVLIKAIGFDIKAITISSLNSIRSNFLKYYFEDKHHENYPNALFDYQKKVEQAGHLEAYNHWLLMKGDEEAFGKWRNSNQSRWDDFVDWFTKNPIQINPENFFHRIQYQ